MKLRRSKSKKQKFTDALGTYLKFEAAGKAAKGATKAAKGTAQAAGRTPVVKRVPLIVAGTAAAVFVAMKARGGGDQPAGA